MVFTQPLVLGAGLRTLVTGLVQLNLIMSSLITQIHKFCGFNFDCTIFLLQKNMSFQVHLTVFLLYQYVYIGHKNICAQLSKDYTGKL